MASGQVVKMTTDQIGDIGELLAALALSRPVLGRYKRPLFRATRLGGKYPAADFIVDVLDADDRCSGFFFAQVKSTTKVRGHRRRRLPLKVDREKLERLAALPAPAYLIGVDLAAERSYVVAASRRPVGGVYGVTMKYCLLDDAVRMKLYREVESYWSRRRWRQTGSEFTDA